MTSAERALTRTLLWMTTGIACAVPVFILPQPQDPLTTITVHLGLLAAFSLGLTMHLASLVGAPWFDGLSVGSAARRGLTWVTLLVLVGGATGISAVATSMALRYDPSLQFFLVLAALGVGSISSAVALGVRRYHGGAAVGSGGVVSVICIWVLWRYLDVVGFTAGGGWIPSAAEWRRLVLPYQMGAVLLAAVVFTVGVGRSSEQP